MFKKISGWKKTLLLILIAVVGVYLLVYIDVVLRARSAYLEGEKYWRWHEHPEEKVAYLNQQEQKELAALDKKLARKKISPDEYEQQKEIIKFNYERLRSESSIKYAYVWYQTAVELFSPPESKWVKLAREKMPRAKELWKEELRRKKILFEDYMLE